MAKKEDIIKLPNSHLRQKSDRVKVITPEILEIIEEMKSATLDWEASRKHEVGVALAGVQIDRLKRIVVVREDFDDKNNKEFVVLINPEIVKLEGEMLDDFEGCLSITDVYGKVPRYSKIRVKALDETGQPIRIKAEGFLARVLQHEIDHMNGVLFIDHIKDSPEAFYRLDESGKLFELDYEKEIRKSSILW